jgi:hypothetical protein
MAQHPIGETALRRDSERVHRDDLGKADVPDLLVSELRITDDLQAIDSADPRRNLKYPDIDKAHGRSRHITPRVVKPGFLEDGGLTFPSSATDGKSQFQ